MISKVWTIGIPIVALALSIIFKNVLWLWFFPGFFLVLGILAVILLIFAERRSEWPLAMALSLGFVTIGIVATFVVGLINMIFNLIF